MPAGSHYELEHPPKAIPPRPQRDRPDGGSFLAGSEGFNVSAAALLCPLTSFAGLVRAGCGGIGVRGRGTQRLPPGAGRGKRPAGPSCPNDSVKRAIRPQKYTCDAQKARPGLPASFSASFSRRRRSQRGGRAGPAYRGATPRGARESTTQCRGQRRTGRPGSLPAAPRSCGAKRTL